MRSLPDGNAAICRCDSCCPDAPDPKATESFRHACEVRYVSGLPSNPARKAYLELVERARGKVAAQRLRLDVWLAVKPA